MSISPQSYPTSILGDQMARLSRWARVALVARAAMRVYPWFTPSPLRAGPLAVNDFHAVDICSTIAAIAAVNGRQLSPNVTGAALRAAQAALDNPQAVPLNPPDIATMLAGLSLEWASNPTSATGIDVGSAANLVAAGEDMQALVQMGLAERGYEYMVPKEFFERPLWTVARDVWFVDLARWQATLTQYPLRGVLERFQRMAEGGGIDWTDAQHRAESWVRMNAAQAPVSSVAAPIVTPPSASVPTFVMPVSVLPPSAEPVGGPALPPIPPPFSAASMPSPAVPAPAIPDPVQPFATTPLPEAMVPLPTLKIPPPAGSSVDFNDLEPYANALAGVVDFLETETTFTMALQGQQGSGRSVLAGMLRRRVASKPSAHGQLPHHTLWFDARASRKAPDLTAGFIRALAAMLDLERSAVHRHLSRMVWKLQPRGTKYLELAIIAACVFAILIIGSGAYLLSPLIPVDWIPYRKDFLVILSDLGLANFMRPLALTAGAVVLLALAELSGFIFRTGRALGRFVSNPQESAARGEIDLVRKELGTMVRGAIPKGSRLVIFVEDLERSGSDRAIEFLESIEEMFRFREFVFVLLTDTAALARHAEDKYREAPGAGWRHLNRFIDLQIDMPVRHALPGDSGRRNPSKPKPSRVRISTFQRVWNVLCGPLKRDWRGDSRFSEVIVRTLYIDPPYLVPFVVLGWLIFILPVWEFATVQRWVFPARCKRVFSRPGKSIWGLILGAALIGHGVLVVQTIMSFLLGHHFVILYPGAPVRSVWVFVPIELVNLGVIGLLAWGTSHTAREEEMGALAAGRASLRRKIDELREAGKMDAIPVMRDLGGVAKVAGGEETLIREAVAESFLVARDQKPLERAKLLVELCLAMDSPDWAKPA